MDNAVILNLQSLSESLSHNKKELLVAEFEDYYQKIIENKSIVGFLLSLDEKTLKDFLSKHIRENYQEIILQDIININKEFFAEELLNHIKKQFLSVNEEIQLFTTDVENDPLGKNINKEKHDLIIEYYIKPFVKENYFNLNILKNISITHFSLISDFFRNEKCEEIIFFAQNNKLK